MMERRGWLMAGVWRTMENSRAGCWGNCGCEQDTMSFGLDQQDVWQDWKMIHVAPKGFVILKCGGEAGHVCGNPRPRERKKMPPASLNRTASGGPNPPGDKTKPAAKQIKVRAGSRMSGNFLIHSPGYILYPKMAIDIYVELSSLVFSKTFGTRDSLSGTCWAAHRDMDVTFQHIVTMTSYVLETITGKFHTQ